MTPDNQLSTDLDALQDLLLAWWYRYRELHPPSNAEDVQEALASD